MRARTLVVVIALAAALSSVVAPRAPFLRGAGPELPRGDHVSAVATSDAGTVIAATRGGLPTVTVAGREVPLDTSGGYADQARWQAIAADGRQLAAIAGARGGAHGNVRWTVWTGTAVGLVEEPQPFETFGGWGMGQLVAVTYVSGEPVIVGSWQSEAAGFDIALWRREPSGLWRRQPTARALASSRTQLVQPSAATGFAGRLVVVGQVNDITAHVRAAAWVLEGGEWTRLVLSGSESSADSVSCDGSGCLVGGRTGDVVSAWFLDGSGIATSVPLPELPADPDSAVFAVVAGARYVVAGHAGRTTILSDGGGTWRDTSIAVPGRPTAAAADDGALALVTDDGDRSWVWTVR